MLHPDLVSATANLRVLSAKGVDSLQVPCRFGEPFVPRRVACLTTQRDQRPNLRLLASVDVVLAGVPGIGGRRLDPAKLLGQLLELFEHRHYLLLIVGRLRDRLLHHQQAVRFDRRLRVVDLLEAAVVRNYSITRLDSRQTKCGIMNR
ncbi:hypothetical protein SBBP2_220012 [Burkholderiales bacterium]|nr:hypothetical protein SBBP2_220012 [Burkholderiales bacterium]